MSARPIAALAQALAAHAEEVCRAYLPAGRRSGHYWIVGDVLGTPGRSLYVRLEGARAGKWSDAAVGHHGDLLDLIALNRGLDLRAAVEEARDFLEMPKMPVPARSEPAAPARLFDAARRLFSASMPIAGTLAEACLRHRGIVLPGDVSALRFHPRCRYRDAAGHSTWPAMIAAVTDAGGNLTGIHRTYLDPSGRGKAPVETPRRALGWLIGNGVRFPPLPASAGFGGHAGVVGDCVAAGEGIETVLSLKTVLPSMPMIAALSAGHLAGLILPPGLHRLYVACDHDDAGQRTFERLAVRGAESGIDVRALVPAAEDFNADLLAFGPEYLRASLAAQLAPEDAFRFLMPTADRTPR